MWGDDNTWPLLFNAAKWVNTLVNTTQTEIWLFVILQKNGRRLLASRIYLLERKTTAYS